MTKCDILFWVESDPRGPFNRMETPGVSVGKCRTHNWSMTDQREVYDGMCPIGRINTIIERGIKSIEKAKRS